MHGHPGLSPVLMEVPTVLPGAMGSVILSLFSCPSAPYLPQTLEAKSSVFTTRHR